MSVLQPQLRCKLYKCTTAGSAPNRCTVCCRPASNPRHQRSVVCQDLPKHGLVWSRQAPPLALWVMSQTEGKLPTSHAGCSLYLHCKAQSMPDIAWNTTARTHKRAHTHMDMRACTHTYTPLPTYILLLPFAAIFLPANTAVHTPS
eukprot:scaffold15792_cov18-Tisochrysis_lutea.AAC.3